MTCDVVNEALRFSRNLGPNIESTIPYSLRMRPSKSSADSTWPTPPTIRTPGSLLAIPSKRYYYWPRRIELNLVMEITMRKKLILCLTRATIVIRLLICCFVLPASGRWPAVHISEGLCHRHCNCGIDSDDCRHRSHSLLVCPSTQQEEIVVHHRQLTVQQRSVHQHGLQSLELTSELTVNYCGSLQ